MTPAARQALIRNAVLAVAALLVIGIGYSMYAAHRGRVQQQDQKETIAALVKEASGILARSLQGDPAAADVAAARQAEQNLADAQPELQRAMARAAGQYLATVRAIATLRAERPRLARAAADSRLALNAHMRSSARRSETWIHQATELQKRTEKDQAELERNLNATADLVGSLDQAEAALAPFVDRAGLVPAAAREHAAAARAKEEAKEAAEALEREKRKEMR